MFMIMQAVKKCAGTMALLGKSIQTSNVHHVQAMYPLLGKVGRRTRHVL
jgi:hypothetical protein